MNKKTLQTFKSLPKKTRFVILTTLLVAFLFVFFVIKTFVNPAEEDLLPQEKGAASVNAEKLLQNKNASITKISNEQHIKDVQARQEQSVKNAKKNNDSHIPSVDEESMVSSVTVRTSEQIREEQLTQAEDDGLLSEEAPPENIFGKTSAFETMQLRTQQNTDAKNKNSLGVTPKQFNQIVNNKTKYLQSVIKNSGFEKGIPLSYDVALPTYVQEESKIDRVSQNGGEYAAIAKRGYLPGDIVIASFDNNLNSDNAMTFARLTIQQGPLKGAKVLAKPMLQNDAFNVQTQTVTFSDKHLPFKAMVVTLNDGMKAAIRTDVDYHIFQNTALLVLGSFLEGASKRAEFSGQSVVTSGSTAVVVNEPISDKDLLLAGVGKVGERAAQAAIANSQRKPTVINEAHKIGLVGLMVTEEFNPQWLRPITNKEVY